MEQLRTPYFLVDEEKLLHNLEILREVAQASGARILLAQKAFSMFDCYPLIAEYLSGTTASGLYEARLGREHFPGEVHVFSPAYREEEFTELLRYADHFVFNSPKQLEKYATVHLKHTGLKVTDKGLLCRNDKGEEVLIPGETVICAVGQRPNRTDVEALRNCAPWVREIGDCIKSANITTAVYQAYHAALDV